MLSKHRYMSGITHNSSSLLSCSSVIDIKAEVLISYPSFINGGIHDFMNVLNA